MNLIHKSMIAVAAFISCAAAYALEVSSDEAREAVAGWASLGDALTGNTRFNASEITSVATYDGADGIGRFYVVSFEGGGYAVTSGDTEISPILAYSESGEFVASDENPLWVLLTQDVAGRTKRLGNGEEGTGKRELGTGKREQGTVGSMSRQRASRPWTARNTPCAPHSTTRPGPIRLKSRRDRQNLQD